MAYEKSGLPILPADRGGTDAGFNHFLPTKMDVVFRQHFVERMLPKDFTRPVECSEPLVETTCIDSKGKLAVPLIKLHRQDDRQPDRPHQRLERRQVDPQYRARRAQERNEGRRDDCHAPARRGGICC